MINEVLVNKKCEVSQFKNEKIIIFGNKGDELKFDKRTILNLNSVISRISSYMT